MKITANAVLLPTSPVKRPRPNRGPHICAASTVALANHGAPQASMDAYEKEHTRCLRSPLVLYEHTRILGAYHLCTWSPWEDG